MKRQSAYPYFALTEIIAILASSMLCQFVHSSKVVSNLVLKQETNLLISSFRSEFKEKNPVS
ncbi:hypothetical protein MUN89_10210 [Halobacillus salinarum]|uniref:Prepilin-type N-terminal cleavage/methylation domain-containing protein n=1 Tax=Halobacillus salinarum TaxID=2932257 RepID=A0ABY4EPE2_9BACI|nr:hypothetical protein [Halobacillus salinarum]UOQ46245.1 hypothetical protein MUN89_10210 [Halobacillus salinarum]